MLRITHAFSPFKIVYCSFFYAEKGSSTVASTFHFEFHSPLCEESSNPIT
jgi:hypothetical protein